MQPADAVGILLALPGVTEADHHGRRSFRVGGGKSGGGTIVATVPADGVLNVMVGADLARAVDAAGVELLVWGRKVSGVRVDLGVVDRALLEQLIEDAWSRRAPAGTRRPPG